MIFGEGERRRTIRTSSENLTKGAEIAAFWRDLTQSPVAKSNGWRGRPKFSGDRAFLLSDTYCMTGILIQIR